MNKEVFEQVQAALLNSECEPIEAFRAALEALSTFTSELPVEQERLADDSLQEMLEGLSL